MDANSFLVLLDINGLLCSKIDKNHKLFENLLTVECNSNYSVLLRPNAGEFLTELSQHYTVGIYSSTTYVNITKILTAISRDWKSYVSIIADRSCTVLNPDFQNVPKIKSYDTVKLLTRIWEHPIHNCDRKWNKNNTLLIDHEEEKLRFNDPRNILIVEEFTISSETNITDLLPQIENKLAELA